MLGRIFPPILGPVLNVNKNLNLVCSSFKALIVYQVSCLLIKICLVLQTIKISRNKVCIKEQATT